MISTTALPYAVVALFLIFESSQVEAKSRIVGGTPTSPGQYPYYAFPANSKLCGATLVSGDILVSAAHCGDEAWKDGLLLGGYNLYSSSNQFYGVSKTLRHPNYDSTTKANDIMLIKLDRTAPGPYVQLNLNRTSPSAAQNLTAIGYGATSETGPISNDMLSVNFFAVGYSDCISKLGPTVIDDLMMCTGGVKEGGRDSCYGDSGGPILLAGTNTQVGIVSFGYGCARADTPSVNTRISTYNDWIQKSICSLSASPPSSCTLPAPTPTATIPTPIALTPVSSTPTKPVAPTVVVPTPIASTPTKPNPPTPVAPSLFAPNAPVAPTVLVPTPVASTPTKPIAPSLFAPTAIVPTPVASTPTKPIVPSPIIPTVIVPIPIAPTPTKPVAPIPTPVASSPIKPVAPTPIAPAPKPATACAMRGSPCSPNMKELCCSRSCFKNKCE